MKELSIEQKAKAYDNSLERARKWYDANTNEGYRGIFEDIFPEFKENEDERIRKELIEFVKSRGGFKQEYIAWLEKQGEQKPWSEEDEINRKAFPNHYGGQKPADKVEPKFHEGEWLCENEPNNYARFIQILEIVNVQGKDRYRISRDIYNDEDIVEFDFVEKYYHKFDIKDAKEGDVLARNNDILSICIFSHFDGINNKISSFLCHCGLEGEGLGQELSINGYYDDSINYVPATKEQREQLEKAMADAGYRWNPDEKKMEKIEQKPAWSEEDESRMDNMCHFLEEYGNQYYGHLTLQGTISWLKSLKDRVQPQPKTHTINKIE